MAYTPGMIAFPDAHFSEETFESLSLTGEEIADRAFEDCVFRGCRFVECRFTRCRFVDCVFDGCLLSAVRFVECPFLETIFHDGKAIGLDWTRGGKSLRGLRFERCDVSHSLFRSATLPGLLLRDCTAVNADFTGADCAKADFRGTDLSQAVFAQTNLAGADFRGAYGYRIDFRSNTLKKAKFSFPEAGSLLQALDIVLEG
jgi:fluoroquinolone resistance protein